MILLNPKVFKMIYSCISIRIFEMVKYSQSYIKNEFIGMDILVHVKVYIECQRKLFMFKQASIIPLLLLQMYEVE